VTVTVHQHISKSFARRSRPESAEIKAEFTKLFDCEKAYAILFQALQEAPGRSGMLAHTMFYVDEIRAENEFRTDVAAVGAKELELAKTFVEALEAPFAPEEFKDEYRAELEAMIAKKAERAAPGPASMPAPVAKPVVDIMEALRKSLEMVRKPPKSEKAEPPAKAVKNRRSRS
jgi:DNA end-binding protein Ku